MIKYPGALNEKNNILGITAISDGTNLEKIDYAIENLNRLGFRIIETPNVRNSKKFISSSGKVRADEFMTLLKNEDVGLIISAGGGEFAVDMLPYLHEYKKQIENYKTKWIQGYSDTSLLLFYITTNFNIATVHSGNIGSFAMKPYHKSLNDNIALWKKDFKSNNFLQTSFEKYQSSYIEVKKPTDSYTLNKKVKYKNLKNNENVSFSGRMIGGCIDVITQVLGTRFDNTVNFCNQFKEGMIWYIDNCELNSCELYRRLMQMKNAGYFKNTNGFIIGRTMVKDDIEKFTFKDALKKALKDLNVPVIYDADIGHVLPQFTIINGAFGKFDYLDKSAKLTQTFI